MSLNMIVALEDYSPLQRALNLGVVSLFSALESWHRPHICLNGLEGHDNLEKVRANPYISVEYVLGSHLIFDGRDAWLNMRFFLYGDGRWVPTNFASLTPRQTSYIIQRLHIEHQKVILDKVKNWYLSSFRKNLEAAFQRIDTEVESGNLMVEGDHENHIFDLHGGRAMEVPYTEWEIAGEKLFTAVRLGGSYGGDWEQCYDRADNYILSREPRSRSEPSDLIDRLRSLRNR